MIITKANANENLGEFICLSITKANAKTNLQIFICNHFCVDGTITFLICQEFNWQSFRCGQYAGADCILASCFWDCDLHGVLLNTKTPQARKYEKNPKKLQNPPFWVGPREYRKNTEKLRKRSENGHFRNFSVFFCILGAQPGMGDFVIFSDFFWYFRAFEGFSYFLAPRGDRNPRISVTRAGVLYFGHFLGDPRESRQLKP